MRLSGCPRVIRGFTLIEILVVLAIVGVISATMVVRLQSSDFNKAMQVAEHMTSVLEAAREQAIFSGRSVAISSDGQGYQLWTAGGANGEWISLPPDGLLAPRRLADGVIWKTQRVNDHVRPLGERIVFAPDGVLDPFMVELGAGDAVVRLEADVMGRIGVSDAARN